MSILVVVLFLFSLSLFMVDVFLIFVVVVFFNESPVLLFNTLL